jgi:hypothetical protein
MVGRHSGCGGETDSGAGERCGDGGEAGEVHRAESELRIAASGKKQTSSPHDLPGHARRTDRALSSLA